ncbi:MAG: hypothetical protein K0R69_1825 [Clostridia bacterium]|nr:hypothetical protein [Clostridia bacterium]
MDKEIVNTRRFWIQSLIKIADPVLTHMAEDTLKAHMPIEQHPMASDREYCTYLEALARLLCGMAPWFEAKDIALAEKEKQQYYLQLALRAIRNAVDEEANDFVYTPKEGKLLEQVLVDTAFLALAFLRAKGALWEGLEANTQKRIIKYFKETRKIQPFYCNWILFSGMIEVFLYQVEEDFDIVRIDYAFKQMEAWYCGDGLYGDGENYHADYYNSYVIQPFLIEMLQHIEPVYRDIKSHKHCMTERAKRYARLQEMSIYPDGSFNSVGRSITYRMGAFHHLAAMAWHQDLPEEITPGQIRGALTKVIEKCLKAPGAFDEKGWLNIGLWGHQPGLGEVYISTGSLYLCSTVFLPLGLDEKSLFWTEDVQKSTMEKVWEGRDLAADHALEE